ncbi:MAG: EAL domain-containing protein [Hahellaceae bacterium]|nr:EAL domain-containing protein [Hahellaceae bacterium]MCP5211417.1 EAL domain-containing protein [Hahellaceae bacterium]
MGKMVKATAMESGLMQMSIGVAVKYGRLLLLLLFVFLLASETTLAVTKKDESRPARVLLVFSYHPTFPTSDRVLKGVASVFPPGTIDLDVEYMDSKRIFDNTLLSNFLQTLSYKLSKRPPYDVVISADDNALNFLVKHKPDLFPQTPLVFLGVNNIDTALSMNDVDGVTGIVEAASFAKTISVATHIFPNRRNVWVLTDATSSGQADLASVQKIKKLFPELTISILSLEGFTWEGWQKNLSALGDQDMVMLLSAYRDMNNTAKDFDESLDILIRSTKAPVFHFWEHGLGDGVIGGHIVSHFEQGRQAALMAKEILSGVPVSDIPVMEESPNVAKFDLNVLKKFSVNQDLLPDDAVLINLPARYEMYRRYLYMTLFAAVSFFLFWLWTLRLQRKVVEEKALLHQLIDSTPDLIVIKDKEHKIQAANKAFQTFIGATESELLRGGDKTMQQTFAELPIGRAEQWFTHAKGHSLLLDIYKSTLLDKMQKVRGSMVIARDVTERHYGEARLRRSEQLLVGAQKLANIGSWELEIDSGNFACTETLCRIFGIDDNLSTVDKNSFLRCVPEVERRTLLSAYEQMQSSGEAVTRTHRIITPNGEERIVCNQFRLELNGVGEPYKLYGAVQDVTKQQQDQAWIRHVSVVFEQASESIMLLNAEKRITDVNQAFEQLTGYTASEAVGKTPALIQSRRYDHCFYDKIWKQVESTGQWQGEMWRRAKNGNEYPEWLSVSTIRSEMDELDGYVLLSSDISLLKQSEEKLDYLAHHDPLTGLPNRLLLQVRMAHSLERARREGTQVAVLFLDLDGFKHINDSLGHAIGDELLRRIGDQLRNRVREEDTIARIGGDEFVIVMEHISEHKQVIAMVSALLLAIQQRHTIHGHDLRVTTSIGISFYPQDAKDAEVLLRNADSAMYKAKSEGRNNYQFYTPELTLDARERVQLESEIDKALLARQFVVYYQPQIDLRSGKITGAEALVRWLHPTRGQISPAQFIPLAEISGQINELGEYVLREACSQWVKWHEAGYTLPNIAVNFSGRQFSDNKLTDKVKQILEDTGCPASRLEVEITENFLMKDVEKTILILHELRDLGCVISVDDFGTGYSSLSYLKRMPVNRLKLDRTFVMDLARDEDDQGISRAVIALASSLNLEVVAEGIETEFQLTFLQREGCQLGQGYFFSPPLPAASFDLFFHQFEERYRGPDGTFCFPVNAG